MKKFKNKLFGAMVIVALGIIFIPMTFEYSIDKSTILPDNIPVTPSLAASSENSLKPAIIEKLINKQHQLAVSEEKINKGWVVQVGTFAVPQHADVLVSKLKKAGYTAYIKKIHHQEAIWSVVMVGPEIKKSEAIKLKAALDSKYSLQATIIEYVPGILP